MAVQAAAGAGLKELLAALKELVSPEMIRALSPTEGFEAKPHTFQAVETEGRWKQEKDFSKRGLWPNPKTVTGLGKYQATLLTIEVRTIDPKWIETLVPLIFQSMFPSTKLAATAMLNSRSLAIPPSVQKILPQISRAIADLEKPASAEVEALWWSDGLEITWGQAAAKHVKGFGSLFGHQARVELDGVSYGNYFPLSYCVTFTGFVNPIGPVFEEIRGAVKLNADGSVEGLFCERSNRDKDKPVPVTYSGKEKGYILNYPLNK
jgi:hypothetical protein